MPTIPIDSEEFNRLILLAQQQEQQHLVLQLQKAKASGITKARLIDSYFEHLKYSPHGLSEYPVFTCRSYYMAVIRAERKQRQLLAKCNQQLLPVE